MFRKLKKEEEKEEKKKLAGGEQKKEKPFIFTSPDPSDDEYVLFCHSSWQPGVPENLYKFKAPL